MIHLTKSEITKMKIKRIEKEIRDTPYHKATEHHIGGLRAKLSKLKESELESSSKKGGGVGYSVKKQGDATVVLAGLPSVGKSTLLNQLTNAKSKIAPYAFTTVNVIPGMMEYKDAKIQILDIPGLIEGAEEGRGRGKEVISVIRNSDLLIILCDVNKISSFETISKTLENSGIRLNKTPPKVTIEKKLKGGINIVSNFKQEFSNETIKQIAKEYRIANADITLKEKLSISSLIDAFSSNPVYISTIYVVNKIDIKNNSKKGSGYETIAISAEKNTNLDNLREEIWKKLEFIRVFLVRTSEKPSDNNPIVMQKGQTLLDVSEKLGTEFAENKKRAKIWGIGAKFAGQEVSLSLKVQEGMQIRFV